MTPKLHDIRLFHIVHVDRLASIASDGFLWSDAEARRRRSPGTTVGMQRLKDQRLRNRLTSYPDLTVGDCVPFYFCPRSVMLYLLSKRNHESVTYRGGQEPIVHLVARLTDVVEWADTQGLRWAFTLSNAASGYAEDRASLDRIGDVDWEAVRATDWRMPRMKEGKQAEFLVEARLAWHLIRGIGVFDQARGEASARAMPADGHRPTVKVYRQWYY